MKKIKIYIASDSTAQTYKKEDKPQTGWGEVIGRYLSEEVEVINKAIGGRSSRSFIEQGRLDEIEKVIEEGDYLFIQFGHNDASIEKTERYVRELDFPFYLKKYISAARNKGATPILLTPVGRRDYDEVTHKFRISFATYRDKMIEVANETQTELIDLGVRSVELFDQIGVEGTKKLFLHVEPNQYAKFPGGVEDNTHFKEEGAIEIAKLIVNDIKRLHNSLASKVK